MCGSCFKSIIPLQPGSNNITIECQHFVARFRLIYRKALSIRPLSHYVQPVYVICVDEEGDFQAPIGISKNQRSACARIGFGLRLLQTLTAEAFLTEYGSRLTFLIKPDTCDVGGENDDDGAGGDFSANCLVHHSKLTTEFVYSAKEEVVWKQLALELYSTYPNNFHETKWVAFMACTRFNQDLPNRRGLDFQTILKYTKGYFALASDGLALLGTGTLHSWPSTIEELQLVLFDTRYLDDVDVQLMDDTAYRHTIWAAFSTGLGSVWHELGHCFGLSHSDGVMYRGGDDIHLCLGFAPPGTVCVDCDRNLDHQTRSDKIRRHDTIPTALPSILQFQQISFLETLSKQKTVLTKMHSDAFRATKQWGYCLSLTHQGTAYWGLKSLVKLSESPWFYSASSKPIL